MSLAHFDDSNFKKEVLESKLPVMVDFWATWCAPCKKIGPFVEELAGEYRGRMKIGKLNVEDSPRAASQYGVMSIPTLIFFKDGKVNSQFSGVASRAELKKRIDENL